MPVQQPLIELHAKPPSEAELRKIEELKKLKAGKLKPMDNAKPAEKDTGLPKLKPDLLPPVMGRKGAFEVPDFLKQNVHKDLISVGERDMFDEALKKQEAKNE